MALFDVLVRALKNGILLERGDSFLLLNTAESRVRISLAAAEVDTSGYGAAFLATLSAELAAATVKPPALAKANFVAGGERRAGQQ